MRNRKFAEDDDDKFAYIHEALLIPIEFGNPDRKSNLEIEEMMVENLKRYKSLCIYRRRLTELLTLNFVPFIGVDTDDSYIKLLPTGIITKEN